MSELYVLNILTAMKSICMFLFNVKNSHIAAQVELVIVLTLRMRKLSVVTLSNLPKLTQALSIRD